eukprot:3752924-Heterocapsa_arctica.AAC.1
MERAQDSMIEYNEEVDNRVRGIGPEGTQLFQDVPFDAIISDQEVRLRRDHSQGPGQYGSDAPASETISMVAMGKRASKIVRAIPAVVTGPSEGPDQAANYSGHPLPLLESGWTFVANARGPKILKHNDDL